MDLFSIFTRKDESKEESPESYTSSVDPNKFLNEVREAHTQQQLAPLKQQILDMNDAQRVDFLYKLNDSARQKPQDSSLPAIEIQGLHSDSHWDNSIRNDRLEDLDILRRTTTASGETKLERIDLFDSLHEEMKRIDQTQLIQDAIEPYRVVLNSEIVRSRADFDDKPDQRDQTMLEQYWNNRSDLEAQMVANLADPNLKNEAIREFAEQSQISSNFYRNPADHSHTTVGTFDVPTSRPFAADDRSMVVYPVGTQSTHNYALDLPTRELQNRLSENSAAIENSPTMEIRRETREEARRAEGYYSKDYRSNSNGLTTFNYGRKSQEYAGRPYSYDEMAKTQAYPLNQYRSSSTERVPIQGSASENRNEFLFGIANPDAGAQPLSSNGQPLEIPDNYIEKSRDTKMAYDVGR